MTLYNMFIGLKSHCPVQGNHPEPVRSEPQNSWPPREPRPSRSPVYQGRSRRLWLSGDLHRDREGKGEMKPRNWVWFKIRVQASPHYPIPQTSRKLVHLKLQPDTTIIHQAPPALDLAVAPGGQ